MKTWFRSLAGWSAWVILTLTLGPVVGMAAALFSRGAGFKVARFWARAMLGAAGVRVEFTGPSPDELPPSAVYVANHNSYVDVLALIARFPLDLVFVAKTSLLALPGLNVAMLGLGHIFIPRGRPSRALRLVRRKGGKEVARGRSVLIFPHGGRAPGGTTGEFKDGASALALWAVVPIVPVGVYGSSRALPIGNWPLRPGRVVINAGKPIDTSAMNFRERRELTEMAKKSVSRLMERAGRSC